MRALTNHQEVSESTGLDIHDFLDQLDNVRKNGKNWRASCPAHEGSRSSLHVAMGDKGILITCFAGCSYHEITAAMGLRPQDLFFDALNSTKRAEYRFHGLNKEIFQLDSFIYFYEHDMSKGILTNDEKQQYRNYLASRIDKVNEHDELKREYDFG